MGAYSPSRLINDTLEKDIKNYKTNSRGLAKFKKKYKGFICRINDYANEPYLIEYNVRMGDPECQTILPLLNRYVTHLFHALMKILKI